LLRAEQAESRQEAKRGEQAAPRDGFVECHW
jgi:hypothetical protein